MTKKFLGRHNKTARISLIFKETNHNMNSIKAFFVTGLISLTIQSKAQGLTFTNPVNEFNATSLIVPEGYQVDVLYQARRAVSYTHLTLPTSFEV